MRMLVPEATQFQVDQVAQRCPANHPRANDTYAEKQRTTTPDGRWNTLARLDIHAPHTY